MENEKTNKISEMLAKLIKNLGSVIDSGTIVGKPISTADGATLLPISKVTVGFICGGGEYGSVKFIKNGESLPFSGGNAGVLSIHPKGLLVEKEGAIHYISTTEQPMERLISSISDLVVNYAEKGTRRE